MSDEDPFGIDEFKFPANWTGPLPLFGLTADR